MAEVIRSRSIAEVSGGLRTWRGKVLYEASYEELAMRTGVTLVVMDRADLLAALASEISAEEVHLGFECIKFVQDDDGVTAHFANGQQVRGDVLIGADGLHSVVRAQLFGDEPPLYAGYAAWRAIVKMTHPRMVVGETWGRGQRFGIVPMGDGRVYWYATKNAPEGERDATGKGKQNLLALFREWHEPIEALLQATDESSILRNDIYDRNPLPRWSEGRVTLLGDAAHPMTPNLGQGACQAIEDSVVLAVCLKKNGNVEASLREYQERRIPRTSGLVKGSRDAGKVGQWQNSLLCWMRDRAVAATPSRVMMRHVTSTVDYDGLTAAERALLVTERKPA